MASSRVYNAIFQHLTAAVAPDRVMDYDDIDDTVTQGQDQFIILEEDFSDRQTVAFGGGHLCQRETAVFTVQCMVPSPQSSPTARAYGDTVRDLIVALKSPDLRLLNISPPTVEKMNDGLWTAAFLDVEIEADYYVVTP